MTPRRLALLLLMVLSLMPLGLRAQWRVQNLPFTGDTAVWMVNVYPGHETYQLEGHTALVVQTPLGEPQAYNYGVFDFNSPNFTARFVKGETDYMAVRWPMGPFLMEYLQDGRRVVAHRLALDAPTRRRLIATLDNHVRPENRTYRYNYLYNNCATRPLAAVESVLPDSIKFGPAPFEAQSSRPMTFRNIMRRYHARYPWYQFGIDLALGSGIDKPIGSREATFAPVEMDLMLDGATVAGKPLVDKTVVINDADPQAAVDEPTPWYGTPDFLFWLLFLAALLFTVYDTINHEVTRWFDAVFFGLVGLTGCVLTYLIFVSVHEATSPNWLYVWINPLALLVPIFIWIKRTKKLLVCYQIANFAALFALSVAWAWLPQSGNTAFIPLIATEMLRSASYIVNTLPRRRAPKNKPTE